MRCLKTVCLLVTVLCLAIIAVAQSQYKVLYTFGTNGTADGSLPEGKLVLDNAGNLYGTTAGGGLGAGTVFQLSPTPDGTWNETILYNFCSQQQCSDGQKPMAGLIFDQLGNLYGTTSSGGQGGNDCCMGTVFELSPPKMPREVWTETVLWRFLGFQGQDGSYPQSKLTFDVAGNLYGTTSGGGSGSRPAGTVFKLTPSGGRTWSETLLYTFQCANQGGGCLTGSAPYAGVTFDKVGNLYGTTWQGGGQGEGGGVVYKLSPGQNGWTQSVLYNFTTGSGGLHGIGPKGEINFDSQGNLYSTVTSGGQFGFGGAFRLTPVNGGHENLLSFNLLDGVDPEAGVLIDPRNGNLYGTNAGGGASCCGTVYRIAGKKVTVLYSFTGGSDGKTPVAGLIADKKGNLYGVAKLGGTFNKGVVFEITH